MLHVALLFRFYLGPKARFEILCTGFTWFLTSQLAASGPPGRLRRPSIQESRANVRKKEFLHSNETGHKTTHEMSPLHRSARGLRVEVSYVNLVGQKILRCQKVCLFFSLSRSLDPFFVLHLATSFRTYHRPTALYSLHWISERFDFDRKKSSIGWRTWNLVISTAQLDFFHREVENHSIQVMHGGVQMATFFT